jgi:drug/metabolite transporter (DMT)-like permease
VLLGEPVRLPLAIGLLLVSLGVRLATWRQRAPVSAHPTQRRAARRSSERATDRARG